MTKPARYSPGPWRMDQNTWDVRCPTRGYEDVREFDGLVCSVGYKPNAHLIAAAPDLLEAVNSWVRYLDDDDGGSFDLEETILNRMRDAIAKATGKNVEE